MRRPPRTSNTGRRRRIELAHRQTHLDISSFARQPWARVTCSSMLCDLSSCVATVARIEQTDAAHRIRQMAKTRIEANPSEGDGE